MARIDPQTRSPRRLRRLIQAIRPADPARRRRRRLGALGAFVGILFVAAYFAIPREAQVTFPVVPPVVERFALRDAKGGLHGREEWRDCRAVLVLAISPNSRKSIATMPSVRALADRAESLGAGVFGLIADPSISAEGRPEDGGIESTGLPDPHGPRAGIVGRLPDCLDARGGRARPRGTPALSRSDRGCWAAESGAVDGPGSRPARVLAEQSADAAGRRSAPVAVADDRRIEGRDLQSGCRPDPPGALRRLPITGGTSGRFRS